MRQAASSNGNLGQTVDVVVIGGGMVGMTLAIALGGAGLAVALVDAQPVSVRVDVAYDGRSSAIAFGSQQVLAGIGVWSGMAVAAQPILDIRVSDGRIGAAAAPLFLHYDRRGLSPSADGAAPLGFIVENRVIRRALLDRLVTLPAVQHLTPAKLVELSRDSTAVMARLTGVRTTAIRARLAVAADGRDSPVRNAAGIRTTEWAYPQTGIVCTVAHERPHHGVAHEHFLPAGPFAMLPMVTAGGLDRSSIVWTERASLAPTMLKLPDDAFAAEIRRRFGDTLGHLRPIGGRWSYPLALLHAERYIDHRLALVGDAAHAIHPIAGQGLNLGLRDVAALAEAVIDSRRLGLDVGDATGLERYQRWRRFDNVVLAAVTDGLNRLFSNDLTPLRLARDLGLAAVDRLPRLKRLLMRHAMGTAGELPRLVRGEPL